MAFVLVVFCFVCNRNFGIRKKLDEFEIHNLLIVSQILILVKLKSTIGLEQFLGN